MELKVYHFINFRCIVCYIILLASASYAKSIVITDLEVLKKIEGDWYRQSKGIGIPMFYGEEETTPFRIHLNIKDSILLIRLYPLENYDFNSSDMGDSAVYLITEYRDKSIRASMKKMDGPEDMMYLYVDLENQEIDGVTFENGDHFFNRDPEKYEQFLLCAYDWKGSNCVLDHQNALTCPDGASTLSTFSLRGDTLIYFGMDKKRQAYIYDTYHHDFVKHSDTEQRLDLVNDSTVALLQPDDTLYLKRMKQEDLALGTGFWGSTSRANVYVNFSNDRVTTNTNDTITLGSLPKHPEEFFNAPIVAHDYTVEGRLVKTLFFNTHNQEWLPTNQGYLLKGNLIPYKLWWEGNVIIDIATGETFSFVEGLATDPLYSFPMLKSNPVVEVAEILNYTQFVYEIHNAQGVLQSKGTTSNGSISVNNLPRGTYLLELQTPTSVQVVKLVKE